MSDLDPYNGYSGAERMAKFREMNAKMASGELPRPFGACELCGDSGVELEYHDEDYSVPYRWDKPAAYAVCHHCHIQKIHARFRSPHRWFAFLAHIRRGGHASDLYGPHADPDLRAKFEAGCNEAKAGADPYFPELRPYRQQAGKEWFAKLTLDPASKINPASRPRP